MFLKNKDKSYINSVNAVLNRNARGMHTSRGRFKRGYEFSYNIDYRFSSALIKADLTSAKDMRSDSVIYYNCGKFNYLSWNYKALRKINLLLILVKK